MNQKHEAKLISKVLDGQLSSYEEIVKTYQNMIYVHTIKILHDHDQAEDATQETFVRAYKNLAKFDSNKPLKPWLYKIATNYCYDQIRKNSRVSTISWEIEDPKPSSLEKVIEAEEKAQVIKAVNKLPKKYRLPLREYYFRNQSYKAIATKLNLGVNTIRTRLRRGKKLLKQELQ